MLDANLQSQLKTYLERVTRPIQITAHADDGAKAQEMLELLTTIESLSDQISLTVLRDGTGRHELRATGDARYVDVAERALYNGFLAGVSLSGDKFFYVNRAANCSAFSTSFGARQCSHPRIACEQRRIAVDRQRHRIASHTYRQHCQCRNRRDRYWPHHREATR